MTRAQLACVEWEFVFFRVALVFAAVSSFSCSVLVFAVRRDVRVRVRVHVRVLS